MITVDSSSGRWQAFCDQIQQFLAADTIDISIDGAVVHGYRSPDSVALWLRDHSDMIRAGRYFENDLRNVVDAFVSAQHASGRVHDFVTTVPTLGSNERENWEKWVRVPVEADVEYRLVNAAYRTWQANGDTEWIAGLLAPLSLALEYSTSHPWRWDPVHELVKRAYTIDTWDFDYTAGRHPWLNFQITDETFWGIMHGDNSGVYEASRYLAKLYRACGDDRHAEEIEAGAASLRKRANDLLFNGEFYTHFHKLVDVTIDGVDESRQLSLSNPMNINRGLATHDIADSIIQAYQARAASTGAFAEWFSIDPPFPVGVFGDDTLVPGSYCNGGVMPLVGGELARAALTSGHEEYGVSIVEKYRKMILDSGETFLWYFPDGTPSSIEKSTSPDAMPTDGWGSSAMLWAFVEGIAGIQDLDCLFRKVHFSPRWIAAGEDRATINVSYPASGASFGYQYHHDSEAKQLKFEVASTADIEAHILLPGGTHAESVRHDGREIDFEQRLTGKSGYAIFNIAVEAGSEIRVSYAG
ncbi:MAG: hypothetical protein HKN43_01685 [Rhodothermales bacterium]|nr:hypothetical protein [Rhodothermales bacterium]